MLLTAKNIRVSLGTREVLNFERLSIYEGERIGLVGENGAGKTTLLDVLAGSRPADAGHVQRNATIARIEQKRGGPDTLSGGERARQALAAAVGSGAALLLADEPTNDMDSEGLRWLERALLSWKGAFVLVSHDRALLDRVCTSIAFIEDGNIRHFPGNFSAFWLQRQLERDFTQTEYERAKQEKQRLKAAIQAAEARSAGMRKAPKRMGNSEARLHKREATQKQQKIDRSAKTLASRIGQQAQRERPRDDPDMRMALGTPAEVVSKVLLRVEALSLSFGDKEVLKNVSLQLPKGSKSILLGANGAGKTSLIREIIGGNPAVTLAPDVRIGVFDQDHMQLEAQSSALDHARGTGASQTQARTVLARLGISGEAVFKPCGVLSGGERAKVLLAMLMLSEDNLLLLDEPTNHLDLFTMPALEGMLSAWSGTLLAITHDRAFVRNVGTRLLFLEDGEVSAFEGTWEEYENA